eukprot:comp22501_c0_seq11/m.56141 comp22501_c0_seq11/g.56141  ORF comp22501_c0_seq11/g.56141 comp22501_c0_seq11/m.56141 type:complete len:331 (+) comp22501_c0_seq11:396-1388(+)
MALLHHVHHPGKLFLKNHVRLQLRYRSNLQALLLVRRLLARRPSKLPGLAAFHLHNMSCPGHRPGIPGLHLGPAHKRCPGRVQRRIHHRRVRLRHGHGPCHPNSGHSVIVPGCCRSVKLNRVLRRLEHLPRRPRRGRGRIRIGHKQRHLHRQSGFQLAHDCKPDKDNHGQQPPRDHARHIRGPSGRNRPVRLHLHHLCDRAQLWNPTDIYIGIHRDPAPDIQRPRCIGDRGTSCFRSCHRPDGWWSSHPGNDRDLDNIRWHCSLQLRLHGLHKHRDFQRRNIGNPKDNRQRPHHQRQHPRTRRDIQDHPVRPDSRCSPRLTRHHKHSDNH